MDFKRLAEVELLDSAPEGATTFVEVNGEVKRVAGGIGGGGYTGYVWDVTDKLTALFLGDDSVGVLNEEEGVAELRLTEDEGLQIIRNSAQAGGLTAYAEGDGIGAPGAKLVVSGTSFVSLEHAVVSASLPLLGSYSSIQVAVIYESGRYTGLVNVQAFLMLGGITGQQS